MHSDEQYAEQFLTGRGLIVSRVPTSTSKTPEFLVDGDRQGYVVEVKSRTDSEGWMRDLRSGQVAEQQRSLGHARWTEDRAREAVAQCRAVDPDHERWWILWLSVDCQASTEAMRDEAIGSLFGVRQVVYHDPNTEEQPMRNCLFAKPGVFERHPEIVAGLIVTGNGLSFCANDEFAPDFSSFQESVLWTSFAQIHPPTTAADLAQNRGFFRADYLSVDRRDESALVASLERTYRLPKAFVLDMQVHSVSVLSQGS